MLGLCLFVLSLVCFVSVYFVFVLFCFGFALGFISKVMSGVLSRAVTLELSNVLLSL